MLNIKRYFSWDSTIHIFHLWETWNWAFYFNTMHAVPLISDALWKAHPGLSSDVTHVGAWPMEHILCLLKWEQMGGKCSFYKARS